MLEQKGFYQNLVRTKVVRTKVAKTNVAETRLLEQNPFHRTMPKQNDIRTNVF